MTRDYLYRLIESNLEHSSDTTRIRWIMEANGWKSAEDVRDKASDEQIQAIPLVWGLSAYVP